jgi:hypothetical protein
MPTVLLSADLGHVDALILLQGQLVVVCCSLPGCMHQLCVLHSLKEKKTTKIKSAY